MKGAGPSRLFLALWPDDATRRALARRRDAWAWCVDAVPERTEKLHLTLHFLGPIPLARRSGLIDGLRVPLSPFTLLLDRTRCWPSGVAVLIPTAVPQALLALHAALRDGLERLQVAPETRRWQPHLTLARRAGESAAPAQSAPVHWQVRGYALVASNAAAGDYLVLRYYGSSTAGAEDGVSG